MLAIKVGGEEGFGGVHVLDIYIHTISEEKSRVKRCCCIRKIQTNANLFFCFFGSLLTENDNTTDVALCPGCVARRVTWMKYDVLLHVQKGACGLHVPVMGKESTQMW